MMYFRKVVLFEKKKHRPEKGRETCSNIKYSVMGFCDGFVFAVGSLKAKWDNSQTCWSDVLTLIFR